MFEHTFADVLLPHRCPVCGRAGPTPCGPCAADLPPPPALPPPPGLHACHAAVAYRDGGRAIVAALKFRGANGPLPWVAEQLAARIRLDGLDVVTWVPTTPAHRRHRGRDQAEAVANAVAARLGRPTVPLLRRWAGPPQASRSAAARRQGPPLALAARPGARLARAGVGQPPASRSAAARARPARSRAFSPLIAGSARGTAFDARGSAGQRPPLALAARPDAGPADDLGGLGVLVVDDVVTTGGSMTAAAAVLRRAGAGRVVGAAVARTPPGWFR